jgi:hypothetical protein
VAAAGFHQRRFGQRIHGSILWRDVAEKHPANLRRYEAGPEIGNTSDAIAIADGYPEIAGGSRRQRAAQDPLADETSGLRRATERPANAQARIAGAWARRTRCIRREPQRNSATEALRRTAGVQASPITGTNVGSEGTPRAPRSLKETTAVFKTSAAARDWFGDDFVDHFAATREWEWRQWQDAVTDWERMRYFEIV